jgi:hypothetical protein
MIRRNNCLCDTWCLLFCLDECIVCRVEWNEFHSNLHTRQSSTQNNKYQVLQKHSCFSWWLAHSRPKHIEIDKYIKINYTKKTLCTKLALFTIIQHKLTSDSTNRKQCDIWGCYSGSNMPVHPVSYSRILDFFISKQLSWSGKGQNKFSELLLRSHTRLLHEIFKASAHNFIILAALSIGTRCVPLILRQAYYFKMFDDRLSST